MKYLKAIIVALLSGSLLACGSSGSNRRIYMTQEERTTTLAALRAPATSANANAVASLALNACDGGLPLTRDPLAPSVPCKTLSGIAAFLYANVGDYSNASKFALPYRNSNLINIGAFVDDSSPTVTKDTPRKLYNGDYLSFLIADGLGRPDAKELMYRAYIYGSSYQYEVAKYPELYMDMAIRPFDIENFPKDAERLDGPHAALQAKKFLEKIVRQLDPIERSIWKDGNGKPNRASYAKVLTLYEYAAAEAKKLNLDRRYIDYLESTINLYAELTASTVLAD